MSYLDDPRVFFAAERTLLAWQRTAIALIGLGFVIERFGLFIRLVSASQGTTVPHQSESLIFGTILLTLGALIAVSSAVQFKRFVATLSDLEVPRGHPSWLGPAVNFCLAAIGICTAGWMIHLH